MYQKIDLPKNGSKIKKKNGEIDIPVDPIIPVIEGDGIGPEVFNAAKKVLEKAAEVTGREINWVKIFAGKDASEKYGSYLPKETLEAIKDFHVALKGPLTTPVGRGFRSLNVAIRQRLDLYACVRPVYFIEGVPSPLKKPEDVDLVVFRENTEDVYAGIEWEKGSVPARKVINFLNKEMGCDIREDSGIGIKPISEFGSKRLVRKAINYAIENGRDSVTLVHKGNIMKYTEGAFRSWGYELAEKEFPEKTVTEEKLWDKFGGENPGDKIVIKDRIADNMLQQIVLRPGDFDVLALPNLNGDYVSDAAAGLVGGLGVAPGSNWGDDAVVFEPTHGTAPEFAGKDQVNPTAMILTGRLMFQYLGWKDAAKIVLKAVEKTVLDKKVTFDLFEQIKGGEKVKCSEFAELVASKI